MEIAQELELDMYNAAILFHSKVSKNLQTSV